MQAAYGVLDRFKISRTFFVKTNQADCTILPDPAAKDDIEYKRANVDVQEKSVGVVPDVAVDKVVDPPIEVREINIYNSSCLTYTHNCTDAQYLVIGIEFKKLFYIVGIISDNHFIIPLPRHQWYTLFCRRN